MVSKKATQLMIISMVTNFATLLSSVFVTIFLWRITSDVLSIAKYNLVICFVFTAVFPLLSYISKKYSATLVFRISIVFQILYFGSIILTGDHAVEYIYLFGLLSGIGSAASANSINQLMVQFTLPENRSWFLSVSGTLNSISAMVSPMLSGVIISLFDGLTGYNFLFATSMVLYTAAFAMSTWFKEKSPRREFSFFKNLFDCPPAIQLVNVTQFVVGIRDGIFGFLINLLMFNIVQTEGLFGVATSFSKLIVVLTFWTGSRWICKSNLFRHLRYSMWLMFAAPIPLFFWANQVGLLSQMVLDSVASPLVAITLNSLLYNSIEGAAKSENLEELLAVKEVWLGTGKVVGIAGFIVLYPLLSQQWIYALMLVTNLCYVLSYFIFKRVQNYNNK